MKKSAETNLAIESYFEARSNIRELEQRQFTIINFFLGSFAAIAGGSIALIQNTQPSELQLLAITFILLSNLFSVSLFFSWCSLTLMINRAALFCLDIINYNFPEEENLFWESWIRSSKNTSSLPFLIESTLIVFLTPTWATLILAFNFIDNDYVVLTSGSLATIAGSTILIVQYRWVLNQIKKSWTNKTLI